ncbi:type II toxin-antitoxin system VapC family toxin [Rhodoferax sp. 4810]|nr:type II toxin-antitoxin system VapC family toxin [Rhodoferax jenense]
MTPQRVVLDTDIVIDLLKKSPATVARFLALAAVPTTFLVNPIVVAEVYAGAFAREHKDIEAFFNLCQRIDTDSDTGRTAGLYANRYAKAFQGISLEDYLIAATAKNQRCPLWTRNRKHYPMADIELLAA